MRHRAEMLLIAAVGAFAVTGALAIGRWRAENLAAVPELPAVVDGTARADAATWFSGIRQYCNPVEVVSRLRSEPPPPQPEGEMYEAACYALAGRIASARKVIEGLPEERQYEAACIVFEAGHPAADAGDNVAAGPLMELVVEFWPDHYMALYHAGAARFDLGDYDVAEGYLERFLAVYATEDGWSSSARSMLERIRKAR